MVWRTSCVCDWNSHHYLVTSCIRLNLSSCFYFFWRDILSFKSLIIGGRLLTNWKILFHREITANLKLTLQVCAFFFQCISTNLGYLKQEQSSEKNSSGIIYTVAGENKRYTFTKGMSAKGGVDKMEKSKLKVANIVLCYKLWFRSILPPDFLFIFWTWDLIQLFINTFTTIFSCKIISRLILL